MILIGETVACPSGLGLFFARFCMIKSVLRSSLAILYAGVESEMIEIVQEDFLSQFLFEADAGERSLV